MSDAHGSARALFAKRRRDERYAAVECEVELAVRLVAEAGRRRARGAARKAERDCFIGASLTVKPTYRWTCR